MSRFKAFGLSVAAYPAPKVKDSSNNHLYTLSTKLIIVRF